MTPSFSKPTDARIREFLAQQNHLTFSYTEIGQSSDGSPPGYDVDHNRIPLGHGQAVYDAACSALQRWEMFPRSWTEVHPAATPFAVGNTVAVLFNVFGMWWINSCRIVYLLQEPESSSIRKFGFAYGTLPSHVERGEERFSIEWLADDSVWYDIRAFSRPRLWLARIAYPVARRLQRRFVCDSQAAMQSAVAGS